MLDEVCYILKLFQLLVRGPFDLKLLSLAWRFPKWRLLLPFYEHALALLSRGNGLNSLGLQVDTTWASPGAFLASSENEYQVGAPRVRGGLTRNHSMSAPLQGAPPPLERDL